VATPEITKPEDRVLTENEQLAGINADYEERYGFHDAENYLYKAPKGLNREIVEKISEFKSEPQWMREFRLKALEHFYARSQPTWGSPLMAEVDYDNIHYFVRASEKPGRSWDDVPDDVKRTFDRLGIPEAERKFLSGVGAQYESEVVYHQVREDLEKQGVIFKDMDSALREHEELVRQYFATVIPPNDNKLAALNSSVWSGGSFVYVPEGVHVEMPLQAYFRINTENMGQFERTLIIAEPGSYVHYVEGCFLAGSMVRVRDGEKPIEELQAGDEVLTHRGRFRRVREPMRRKRSGPIYHIKFQGEGYRSLAVTPGHPFLVAPRRRERDHNKVFEPQWLTAQELRKGDYLAVPAKIEGGIPPQLLVDAEVSVGAGRHQAVLERVPVAVDDKMCRVMGLYLAEGSVSANTSYLCFDSAEDEQDLRDLVRGVIGGAFDAGEWEYDYAGQRAGRSLRFSSVRAARFFAQTFGRTTDELRIPDWVFSLSDRDRAAFIRGLYDGEGSYDVGLDLYRINQTNQHVAQRLRELLLSLGIRASLSASERPLPRRTMWQVAISKADHPRFEQLVLGREPRPQRATHAQSVLANGYLWMPISSIEQLHAECEVFNMSVEDDESYVCEGVVSHNCTAPTYSSSSLHSAVVELIAQPGARIRYTTVQNWSTNVFNLVTKRAVAYADATVEWVDCNLGCLTAEAKVYTRDRGPVSIAEIREGDFVFGTDLVSMRPVARQVTATRDNGIQPTFRVTTANFRQLEATGNHPFLVLDRAPDDAAFTVRWRRLENVKVGDYIAVSKGLGDTGSSRFLGDYTYGEVKGGRAKPIKLPLETDEQLMWLLGAYIGDGYIERVDGRPRRVNFAVPPNDPARARLEAALRELFDVAGVQKGPVSLAIASSVLADFIYWLGFAGSAREQRIPAWVWGLPVAQKLAFIEGYLDTDGCERKRQIKDGVEYGQIVWSSANRALLEDLKLLLIDCGLEPRKISEYSFTKKLPLGAEEKTYANYFLAMNLRGNLDVIKRRTAPPHPVVQFVKVTSIDELAAQPTYDIEVDGIENFTANGIVVHNSHLTMKYPSVYLMGERAHGEVLSIAFAGKGQHQDAGAKIIHAAPNTTSNIFAKSICKDGGRGSYRGLLEIAKGAHGAHSKVVCDALLLDEHSRSDTYPTIRISEDDVNVGHEATVSKVGDDQLFYLMSHGIPEDEASKLIVNGFIEPITKELPMEYAVEMNRLIELQMEGSIG
jgi:Fe-S cluster assembly scaffold protein SufB